VALRLSKRRFLVSEADHNEVFEEVVEAFDVAGRVGCEVPRPLDGLSERGIGPAFAVNVSPASCFENHYEICRRVLAGEPVGDGLDFLGDVVGLDGD